MNEAVMEKKKWWALPALWASGIALFIPLLRNRFIGDDYTALLIFKAYKTKPFFETVLYGGNDFFRPLNLALIMARGALFGDNPLPYVLANIAMHLVNTTMVYLIASRVFKKTLAAVSSSVLFLVAFSHYEAITWISGSVTLFVTFFILMTLYSYMRFREKGRGFWLGFSLASYILAFLMQEASIALPLLLPLYDLILVRKADRTRGFFYPYIVFGAILAAYIVLQFSWAYRFIGSEGIYKPGWHILTNLFDYWVWLWMPNPRHPYVASVLGILPPPLLWVYWALAAVAALTLPLIILLACLRKLSRPLLWSFLLAVATLLVFLPFTIKISARYPYLPSVGISLFAGGLFSAAWEFFKERRRTALIWALCVLGGIYLACNVFATILVQKEFVRVSVLTERLAVDMEKLTDFGKDDVIFIEELPSHIHLHEAVNWISGKEVTIYASNDAYRKTPRTLEETREWFKGKKGDLYHLRFESGKLELVSKEHLSP
ncbi:glycosyltransferase family 39 protein [bacterium]|nr:glycosyltransferase family 39 protein [bacterium]